MEKNILLLFLIIVSFNHSQSASLSEPKKSEIIVAVGIGGQNNNRNIVVPTIVRANSQIDDERGLSSSPNGLDNPIAITTARPLITSGNQILSTTTKTSESETTTSSTTQDLDLDDSFSTQSGSNPISSTQATNENDQRANSGDSNKQNNSNNNNSGKTGGDATGSGNSVINQSGPTIRPPLKNNKSNNFELNVLFYSIFIVYVSFIKLIYHNVELIKKNLTEPGMLMIFGIIWELVLKQITNNYDPSPRFNSRVFFYLFLPSTVLEAASLLSNKWLFLNLLPILIHSIIGTLVYASALAFTIFSLSEQNIFNLNSGNNSNSNSNTNTNNNANNNNNNGNNNNNNPISGSNQPPSTSPLYFTSNHHPLIDLSYNSTSPLQQQPRQLEDLGILTNQIPDQSTSYQTSTIEIQNPSLDYNNFKAYLTSSSSYDNLNNLNLTDCLILGTILSSIDSTTILSTFRLLQVNDKLYYQVLGENLMNNAVVLVVFDLLLEFFNETRLTVVKIYFTVMQFFLTLFGSVFIGLILAGVALFSIRLTKRFQGQTSSLTNYQNQCQAMVETLLIIKLAYLTYTIASLAGTSSIVSLATFGILQDQYIKHNLNLRSQLAFRQVILATKTMGYSLVYPLLGMLLVEVANTSQFFQNWLSFESNSVSLTSASSTSALNKLLTTSITGTGRGDILMEPASMNTAASVASSKLSHLASQAGLYWNYKFLSLLILITLSYRFLIVMSLSLFCNLFTSSQLSIKFREQILLAYGGLKGPLAFALVHRLVEHEEYRDRTMRNKHLFMYTILFITFISTILKGCFIRPLVTKMQLTLSHSTSSATTTANSNIGIINSNPLSPTSPNTTIVFDEINCKVTELLSDGLNCLLGHTKSPYDKFADFNETHIKPWLARDGSNTNWLSLFYDNLILDETLNANCFYKSDEFLQLGNIVRINQQYPRRRRTSSTHQLDTIDEHKIDPVVKNNQRFRKISPSSDTRTYLNQLRARKSLSGSSEDTINSRNRLNSKFIDHSNKASDQVSHSLASQQKDKILKELIMFNLKLEEARRRKRNQLANSESLAKIRQYQHRPSVDDDNDDWDLSTMEKTTSFIEKPISINPKSSIKSLALKQQMLSSTESDQDDKLNDRNEIGKNSKQSQVLNIERKLDEINSSGNEIRRDDGDKKLGIAVKRRLTITRGKERILAEGPKADLDKPSHHSGEQSHSHNTNSRLNKNSSGRSITERSGQISSMVRPGDEAKTSGPKRAQVNQNLHVQRRKQRRVKNRRI